MSALNFDNHQIPGYKPIIGGVRHLTARAGQPPEGTWVDLLCGGNHQVGRNAGKKAIYDCSHCFEVWLDMREDHPPAGAATSPSGAFAPLGGRVRKPAGAGRHPEMPASAGPPTEGAM